MSYCFNPICPKPQNPDIAKFCLSCGTRLLLGDRYQAYTLLGGGHSSRTFVGVDRHTPIDPRCIIKQFTSEERDDAFRREVARLAEVGQHPQIPNILAYFERDRQQYLVQEFVKGRTLLQQLQEEGSFDESQIRQLLDDLLPLLQFLHDHQIIHRDIKPSNVMRSAHPALILVDFGSAKYATASALAQPGTVLGSAEYVAPEQLRGNAIFVSDFYSLGVTCLHLLTGLRPFDLFNSATQTWLWQSVAVGVSDRLMQVLDRMVQPTASDRYPSAREIWRDLNPDRAFPVNGAPIQIKPSGFGACAQQPWQCTQTLNIGSPVTAIAPCPLSGFLVVGCGSTVQLWDLQRGERVRVYAGHQGLVTTVAVSSDERLIASGSWDTTVNLWDRTAGTQLHTCSGHRNIVTSVSFAPDGQTVISGSRDTDIKVWDVGTAALLHTFEAHTAAIEAIALSVDPNILASGDASGSVKIWHLGTRELLRTLSGHGAAVSALAIHPDRETLVSGSWDITIRVRNLNTGALHQCLSGHLLPVTAVAISASGDRLATASHDHTIRLWQLADGSALSILKGHTAAVEAVLFDQATTLISASQDGTVKRWQPQ